MSETLYLVVNETNPFRPTSFYTTLDAAKEAANSAVEFLRKMSAAGPMNDVTFMIIEVPIVAVVQFKGTPNENLR